MSDSNVDPVGERPPQPLKMTISLQKTSDGSEKCLVKDNPNEDGFVSPVNGIGAPNSQASKSNQNSKDGDEKKSSSSNKVSSGSSSHGSDKPRDHHHSSSSKSSSSKDREKSSSSSSHRDSNHSSSSSKPREHSLSSSSSKHKDGTSSSSSKDGSSSKHREHSSSTPREGSSSKEGSSSRTESSSKSRDDKSKHSSSSKEGGSSSREDGKPKHSSSSSSSSKPKESSSSSKSSSSHGDKHRSSSSGGDKSNRESSSKSSSDRPKSSSSSSQSKDTSVSKSSSGVKLEGSSSHSSVKLEGSSSHSSVKLEGSSSHSSVKLEGSSSHSSVKLEGSSSAKVKSEMSSPKLEQLSPKKVKVEDEDEDIPLSARMNQIKPELQTMDNDDDEDICLSARMNKVKEEEPMDDDDDVPLSDRIKTESKSKLKTKRKHEDSGDDSDVPLSARMDKAKKMKVEKKHSSEKKRKYDVDEDEDFSQKSSKKNHDKKNKVKQEAASPVKKGKKQKGPEEEETKWKWWEEQKKDEGVKWNSLEHKGPLFAEPYQRLPDNIRFYYDGKQVKLSQDAEEVAGFYAKMLDHEYTTRDLFNKNFFKDWRKVMTSDEKNLITDLKKCNFKEMCEYFKVLSEERKAMSKEAKQEIKKKNEEIQNEYGFCIIDGHKQKIGNFRIEPPGLFRGRGEHPKQGMHKRRVMPEDVIINCSKGSKIPPPPAGHKWKEVRHDNAVTWLCSWSENIQGAIKYVMLNAASKLKGEKDWMKYETARKLHKCVDKIRANYREDFKSKEMRIRQRAVAMYFIDKLALRAGNEKDEDTADTVGCCSLRVEHIKLHEEMDGKECVVEFDFLGKDSIRYYNAVAVEKRVFKNLQLFVENKNPGDDLFDRLNTGILNKHLQSLMDGLSAKVFRTYNASRTLQEQLNLLTNGDDQLPAKLLSYNRANRAVAILCNHQRAAPKNFGKQMENLQAKLDAKKDAIRAAKKELKDAKSDYKAKKTESARTAMNKKKKSLDRLTEQLAKLEVQQTDKDENKEIALGTSKLNYLDPRISVAWCKKWDVPIEKVYNKTQREKFAWAIDMADEDYSFF